MALQDFRRWHWLALGLLLGPLMGYARLTMREVNLPPGQSISRPSFEKQAPLRNPNGLPRLQNLVLHPHPLQAGSYIITANLVESIIDDDPGQLIWIEATTPYLSSPGPDGDSSVIAFLNAQRQKNSGLSYRLAWWERPPYVIGSWTLGTIVLVGGIWPFLVNMLVFGSIRKPEPEAVSLPPVSPSPADSKPAAGEMAVIDVLEAMQEESQAKAGPIQADLPSANDAPPSTPRRLDSAPVEPAADASNRGPHRAFGGTEADFYPTELGVPRKRGGTHTA